MKTTALFALLLTVFLFQGNLIAQIGFGVEARPFLIFSLTGDEEFLEPENTVGGAIAGLLFLDLAPQLTLKSGIQMTLLRSVQRDYSILLPSDQTGGGNVDPYNSWISSEGTQLYAGIPAELRWMPGAEQQGFYLKIGLEVLAKLTENIESVLYESGMASTASPQLPNLTPEGKPVLIFGNFGLGYSFAEGAFYLEPTVGYSLGEIFQQEGALVSSLRYLMPGLNLGVRF